jgi:acyl-CoA synthetase (NDP forming)
MSIAMKPNEPRFADAQILRSLFSPHAVAVVGASDEPNRFGGAALANLIAHGFSGELFPVNPRREHVQGLRAFPSVSALDHPIDTAVLAIGADAVVDVLAQCEAAGAKSAIVVSSGFSEGAAGAAGVKRTARLQAFLEGSKLVILGPSTTGLSNLLDRYTPRAAANQIAARAARAGPLAVISQSGAVNNIIYNRAQQRRIGIGVGVATGVEMMLDGWDIARYLLDDERIQQIALVLERFGDVERVRTVCEAAARAGKSLIVLKLGQTVLGASAVATHSGSLAGSWTLQKALLQDLGVYLAEDLDQIWEIASLLQHWGRPSKSSKGRIGVWVFSGGEGALLADYADNLNLSLPPPSAAFSETVARTLPLAGCANPFDPSGDVIGKDTLLVDTATAWITQNDYDAFLIACQAQGDLMRPSMEAVSKAIAATKKPVAASFWRIRGMSEGIEEMLQEFPGPVFESSVRALKAYARYVEATEEPVVSGPTVVAAPFAIPADAPYWAVREAMNSGPLRFGEARRVSSEDEAEAAAASVGFPIVAKANVRSTIHKSALGLVRLGLTDARAVREAVASMRGKAAEVGATDFVLETQASAELQVYLGMKRDPDLGPAVLFGSGGVAVEFLDDIASSVAWRFDGAAARRLIGRSKIGRYLAGRSPEIVDRLAEMLAYLAARFAESKLQAIDLNPVLVRLNPPAVTIVDVRVA